MILLLLIGTKYNFIMNVLILGGNGFIGRNIIKKAIKLNWKIYSLNKNKYFYYNLFQFSKLFLKYEICYKKAIIENNYSFFIGEIGRLIMIIIMVNSEK